MSVWRFPQRDFNHRENLRIRKLEDCFGDDLRRRVRRQVEPRLAKLLQGRQRRVVLVQNYAVIKLLVDPRPYNLLDA